MCNPLDVLVHFFDFFYFILYECFFTYLFLAIIYKSYCGFDSLNLHYCSKQQLLNVMFPSFKQSTNKQVDSEGLSPVLSNNIEQLNTKIARKTLNQSQVEQLITLTLISGVREFKC